MQPQQQSYKPGTTTASRIYGKILTYLCLKRDFKVTSMSLDKLSISTIHAAV